MSDYNVTIEQLRKQLQERKNEWWTWHLENPHVWKQFDEDDIEDMLEKIEELRELVDELKELREEQDERLQRDDRAVKKAAPRKKK